MEHIFTNGTDEDILDIQKDIMTVLERAASQGRLRGEPETRRVGASIDQGSLISATSSAAATECAQTLFELWDVLSMRFDPLGEVSKLERDVKKPKSKKRKSESDPQSHRSIIQKQQLLHQIPRKSFAQAAFSCKAYSRALQFFEQHLLDENRGVEQKKGQEERKISPTIEPPESMLSVRPSLASQRNMGEWSDAFLGVFGIGDQDNTTEEDLRFLQNIYAGMDECDGIQGIASIRSTTPSLQEQIIDNESQGHWTDALTCYEQALHSNPDDLEYQKGYLNCLRQLGRHLSTITHIEGISAQSPPEICKALIEYGAAAAWRLGNWHIVHNYSNVAQSETKFEVGLSRVLHALHNNDKESYKMNLEKTRLVVMNLLSSAARESYFRAHPFFVQLHMLQEIEQIKQALGMPQEYKLEQETKWKFFEDDRRLGHSSALPSSSSISGSSATGNSTRHFLMESSDGELELDGKLKQLLSLWATRLERTQPSFDVRESIITLRRVLLTEYGCTQHAGEAWLLLAQEARKAKQFEMAALALHNISRLNALNLDAAIEQAKLLRAKGRFHEALQQLEKCQKIMMTLPMSAPRRSLLSSKSNMFASSPHMTLLQARTNLLMGKWIQDSGAKQSKEVISLYNNAREGFFSMEPRPFAHIEKSYFLLAQFYDKVYQTIKGDRNKKYSNDSIIKYLKNVLLNYGESLRFGHRYIFQSMPRMLTLWLDESESWNNTTNRSTTRTPSGSKSKKDLLKDQITPQEECANITSGWVTTLPPYQWLTALPQIVSRFCHPNIAVFEFLKLIIVKVFNDYPQQTLWTVAGVANSKVRKRADRAKEILNSVIGQCDRASKELVESGLRLFDSLRFVCNFKMPDTKTKSGKKLPEAPLSIRACFQDLLKVRTNLVLVPMQTALTITLPPSKPVDSGSKWGFQDEQITIAGFDDKVEVINSKEMPKKISIKGSDGKYYLFLCKEEKTGDMRKDFRMMEFNSVINRLFREQAESRKRKLRLRTYAALPLSEDCGLIEWVPNTIGLRHAIQKIHTARGIRSDLHGIKRRMDQCGNKTQELLKVFESLCAEYPPVLRYWFLQRFPEPAAWFYSRSCYSRSAAVWSIVGFIVGLGDRHGENVLIDETNGECLHVDFDCLFLRGELCQVPERVPFRLTPNVVDAFGVTGVSGLYRNACEISLEVARSNQAMLMSVMHTFVHDPVSFPVMIDFFFELLGNDRLPCEHTRVFGKE